MGFGLVPEGDRGDVVLEGQVAVLAAPAEGLDRDFEIGLEAHGIHDVPSVEPEALLAFIRTVAADHLRQARVGRRELGVLAVSVEVVGAAEVVLGAGAADRGKLAVAV